MLKLIFWITSFPCFWWRSSTLPFVIVMPIWPRTWFWTWTRTRARTSMRTSHWGFLFAAFCFMTITFCFMSRWCRSRSELKKKYTWKLVNWNSAYHSRVNHTNSNNYLTFSLCWKKCQSFAHIVCLACLPWSWYWPWSSMFTIIRFVAGSNVSLFLYYLSSSSSTNWCWRCCHNKCHRTTTITMLRIIFII